MFHAFNEADLERAEDNYARFLRKAANKLIPSYPDLDAKPSQRLALFQALAPEAIELGLWPMGGYLTWGSARCVHYWYELDNLVIDLLSGHLTGGRVPEYVGGRYMNVGLRYDPFEGSRTPLPKSADTLSCLDSSHLAIEEYRSTPGPAHTQNWSEEAKEALRHIFSRKLRQLNDRELFAVANHNPHEEVMGEVYRNLKRLGLLAWMPLDHRPVCSLYPNLGHVLTPLEF